MGEAILVGRISNGTKSTTVLRTEVITSSVVWNVPLNIVNNTVSVRAFGGGGSTNYNNLSTAGIFGGGGGGGYGGNGASSSSNGGGGGGGYGPQNYASGGGGAAVNGYNGMAGICIIQYQEKVIQIS